MKSIATAAVSALLMSALVIPTAGAASRHDREQYVMKYCSNHSGDRDCRDFKKNRSGWNDRRYRDWYGRHHHGGGGDAAAALFGLAAGAAIGAAAAGSTVVETDGYDDHEARCAAEYRSYDPDTDTYAINSYGDRARCRL